MQPHKKLTAADKSRLKRQRLRDQKRAAALAVRRNSAAVGANAFKASLEGFKLKKGKLPRYFNELINNARRLVYTRALEIDDGGVSRTISDRTKRKLFEITVTLLTTCDLVSGQVGKAKNIGFDPTSHDALMLAHAKRWGEAIPSSTWYRYIDVLKRAGVYNVQEVKKADEAGTVRSRAAYKWLSNQFLLAIGVYSDHIRSQIAASYQRAIANGLSFKWRVFKRQLPLNKRVTSDLFFDPVSDPPPLPH
ncbi:hypothetical protein [Shewanella khirikhana]|uniref:Replication protein n=1 Tax=Shewanella khirikhana TaxID=1965282 RepID=A0ABM7DXP8_9GAMM|nr:hypothetical protein [Shewanella khirikhana]AZQ13313.1 hypothetical protein STH12_04287 [Shewanella khirikhana]